MKHRWWHIRRLTAIAVAAMGIQAAAGATEILIYGNIGDSWYEETVTAKNFLTELQAVDAGDDLVVRINSFGGSVKDGLAIHNALKRWTGKVTTCVDGVAFSIASLIAQAGTTRQIAANALFMVHGPWTSYAQGNARDLRLMADQLDTFAAAMATSYAAASGKKQADCLALLQDGEDHYYSAEEAVAEGFADEVTEGQDPEAMALAIGVLGVLKEHADVPANWLESIGGAAAVKAASASAATAASLQEANMTLRKFSVLAGLRLMAPQGADGGAGGGGSPTAAPAAQAPAAPAAPAATPAAPAPAGAPAAVEVNAAQREAVLAAETARATAVRAVFEPFMAHAGVPALRERCLANFGTTPEAAGQQLLALIGGQAQPAGGAVAVPEGAVFTGPNARAQAIGDALLVRAGYGTAEQRRDINANPFRGRTLLAVAEACLQAAGVRTATMDPRTIVGLAFTQGTSDFPTLLENALHKVLQAAYAKKALTWRRWCKVGTVSDFREHKRLRTGSIGNLQAKNELGEYKHVSIPDGEKQGITASTKGLIITISREAIINDDLGALTDQAANVGQAAARTIEADAFASLLSNAGAGPTMSDGNPLFHASHNNIVSTTPGAPSSAQFKEIKRLMGMQMEHTGLDYLDLTPAVGLFPLGMDDDARLINENEYEVSTSKNQLTKNIGRGLFRDIVGTPRLSGTAYYAFADPEECAAMEVAFLNGQSEPFMEMHQAFTTDGGALKARLDYGVGGHNWRGAIKNPGQ